MRGRGRDSGSDTQEALASEDSFEQAHRELLEDRSIQFDLPLVPRPEVPKAGELDPFLSGSPDLGAVPQILFWVVIALAAAGLLYLILGRLAGWQRRERPVEQAPSEWQIPQEPARRLLDDADALAAQGRYSEAAHLLLHRSIEEIDRRRPAAVRKALTSRDIARLPAIPPSPAEAFAAIVRAVERSLFGACTLNERDWRQCREAYQRFAFAREWQA